MLYTVGDYIGTTTKPVFWFKRTAQCTYNKCKKRDIATAAVAAKTDALEAATRK